MPDALQTALTRLGRSRYMVFIDWTNDQTFTNNVWTRVKKSTQSTYTANEETEDFGYIDSDDDVTELVGNKLSIALDQANIDGDPNYNHLEQMMVDLPTGEDAKRPILYCFGGSSMLAVRGIGTFIDKELSPTDKTISYSVSVADKVAGTYEVVSGAPVFTPTSQTTTTP